MPFLSGQGYTITTVAGNGVLGFTGDNLPAINAEIWALAGIAADNAGNLYIADTGNSRIRKVTASTGIITTVAGIGVHSFSGDGGPATSASFYFPRGIAVDLAGNIYVGDTGNFRIRKIDTNGIITTIAGIGLLGYSGDGGLAVNAQINNVGGLVVDPAGNLIFADGSNNRIRKIAPNGIISTIIGTGVLGFTGNGGGPALSANISNPNSAAFDAAGNFYFVELENEDVRMVTPGGIISTVAGNGTFGSGGDGGQAIAAQLNDPQGAVVDSTGNMYITDEDNQRVRVVSPSGIITTIAGDGTKNFSGDGGPATSSQISLPEGLAVGPTGIVYFVDSGNNRIRALVPPPNKQLPAITPGGVVSASAFGEFIAIAPGSWIEIYGTNLAAATNTWAGVNFKGTAAPTSLIGTSVTIGGAAAFVEYVDPGHLNVQVPSNAATGSSALIVTTPAGSSAPYAIQVNATEPGLLAPPSFIVGGTQYVVALFSDALTYALPPGAIPGVTSKRAKAGDILTLYGVGFGPVTPAIPAGQIVTVANALTAHMQVMFGQTQAVMQYAGLAPSAIGLYQFNVVVPNVPPSDTTPLGFTLGGVSGTQTLFIPVQ
jgi:uncharacterized protein (TIGR03437 family)